MNKMRVTPNYVHYRLLGYAATLALHGGNSIAMYLALQSDIMNEPELQTFHSLQWVYITIWNVLFQLIYASIGILCDLPTLLEMKEHKLLKYLKSLRTIMFVSAIVPAGLLVFSLFWPVYIYDREMIFPSFIDKVLSQISNHIMHTSICPIVLWEFMFLPKTEPKSHKYNLVFGYGLLIYYLYVLFSTFAARGVWPYPILEHVYGTIYFPIVFIVVILSTYVVYFGQWRVNALLWGPGSKIKKKEH